MIATADNVQTDGTKNGQRAQRHRLEPSRFTLDGSPELEDHLERTCREVLAGVRRVIPDQNLEGLLLGGGYGRGEGGVLKTGGGDRPYNDLEFYVLTRGHRFRSGRRERVALHELGEQLAPSAGVEIEFKLLSAERLRRSPISMFYHDLLVGHRALWGGKGLLDGCEHHRDAARIPLSEATRLLMNRCTGLLFARERLERLQFSSEDGDFVRRNLAKAQLAFGDAVLTVFGKYHWSCRERHSRLQHLEATKDLPWLAEVQRHHLSGVSFKLHPHRSDESHSALVKKHGELSAFALQLWLWLESRRLGCRFFDSRDYACSPVNKCPETRGWRNLALNLATFGLPGAF
ncbi:MAG TPA: hypothetical protein VN887_19650, partial [Candidatus Angelobacter sp.]|nr:hypothetical protein [Candidatus Angelobacter sp.]